MTTTEPTPTPSMGGGTAPGLVDRAKNIIMQPKAEWERIATESGTSGTSLLMSYALPLMVLAQVCAMIGTVLFNPFAHMGGAVSMVTLLMIGGVMAVVGIVLGLVVVYLVGLVINALAPTFASTANQDHALKVAIYSGTAGWLAGCLAIFPPLAILAWIGGLYGLYVLYQGLGPMMKTPEDKRIVYVLVLLVVWAIMMAIIGAIVATISLTLIGTLITGAAGAMGGVGGYGY